MALTGIQNLNYPFIVVKDSNSVQSFTPVNTTWVFGNVQQVYPNGTDKFHVGASVFYDKSKSYRVQQSGISYYVIDQQYVLFTETALP